MLPADRLRLLRNRRAPDIVASRRRAAGGVDHRQCRGMGHPASDAAHGADAAGRRFAVAGHSELGLARIRQPRRLLAHAQGVRRIRSAGRARHQRLGDRGLQPIAQAALERGWEFMGHGFARRTCRRCEDEREDIRRTTEAIKASPASAPRGWLGPGLTETWETPDILTGRLRLRLRLGAGRSAGAAEDAQRADRQHALHAGMQRRRHDADPASQGVGISRPRDRPVRADLRGAATAPASWRWSCIPTSWARRIG